jgi:diguanylate cyclase (GGDEF)-like protein
MRRKSRRPAVYRALTAGSAPVILSSTRGKNRMKISTGIQESILEICIEINCLARKVYHRFSETSREETWKDRWRALERDEDAHVGFWNILLENERAGIIPDMFDDPPAVRRVLQETLDKLNAGMTALNEVKDLQEMLTFASRIEVSFLDQTLLQLLKFIKTVADGIRPFEEYHAHLERFLGMVREFGESDELQLVGESIGRLWTDNVRLMDSAFVDPLTGLFNRRGFFQSIVPLANLAKRKGSIVAVALVDVDRFKEINDLQGHQAGDGVLRRVALAVKESIRTSDVPARFGGDEFIVFLPEVDPSYLAAIGQKLMKRVRSMKEIKGQVTVSVGFSHAVMGKKEDTEKQLNTLLKEADDNLYRAKETGRDRVVVEET